MVTMTTMFLFLLFMTPVTMPLHTAEHKVTCMNPQVEESHQFPDISYYRYLTIYIFKGSEGNTYSEDCRKYTCQADGEIGVWNDQPDTYVHNYYKIYSVVQVKYSTVK